MTQNDETIRLLLVDDELDFLDATSRALGRRGFQVQCASDAEAAWRLLLQGLPDVVVTDVKMPGMDGATLFERIHDRWPALPVILLTGHGTVQQAFQTSRKGVFEYLAKPYDLDRLSEILRKAVAQSQSRRAESAEPISVLIVDDEKDWIDAVSIALERRGLEVETCLSGDRALAVLQSRTFSVVVLDVRMPGIDGLEVLRRIKAIRPTTEVILLSGHPSVRAVSTGFQDGAFDYLSKPIRMEDLVARIRTAHEASLRRRDADQRRLVEELVQGKPD